MLYAFPRSPLMRYASHASVDNQQGTSGGHDDNTSLSPFVPLASHRPTHRPRLLSRGGSGGVIVALVAAMARAAKGLNREITSAEVNGSPPVTAASIRASTAKYSARRHPLGGRAGGHPCAAQFPALSPGRGGRTLALALALALGE